MPLRQRSSSGTPGRGSQGGSAGQPASSGAGRARDSPPADRPSSARDDDERLLAANTELNKVNAENDRLRSLLEAANQKLSKSSQDVSELKTQAQVFRDDGRLLRETAQQLEEDKVKLNNENIAWEKCYSDLEAKYDSLILRYSASNAPPPANPMAGPLPDRTKPSRTASKRESREQREDRGRGQDRDRERREQQREQRAEKERLSRRFDDRRPPTNHRNSFIEGWGPSGRSASANPSGRAFANVATARMQGPAFTPSQQAAYSTVPRTANPMSPGLYSGSGSGSSAVYDDDYEDGNYHAFPIAR